MSSYTSYMFCFSCGTSTMDKINIDLSDYSDSTLFNLIEEVQKNEFLYDIPPSSRKNQELTNKREKTWNEIAWVFGLPANEVRSIWSKLRQGFVRHFKIYQSSKNTDKPFNPNNWKYFDSLLYLIPFLQLGPLAAPARPKNSTQIASQTAAKRAVKRSRNILLTQASSDKAGRTQESQNLIEAVRNKPQLWELIGKSGALTREENEIRDSAFEEIAQELGSDAKTLKKTWWRLYYNYCTGKLSKDGELYNLMRVFDKTGIDSEDSGNAEADASTTNDNLQFTRTPPQPLSSSIKQRPSSTVTRPSVSASPAVKRKYPSTAASDSMRTNGVSHYSSLSVSFIMYTCIASKLTCEVYAIRW